jgi:hypothetical protein
MHKYSLQGKYALLAVAALALSACGGGGGGGGSTAPVSNLVTVSPSLGKFSAGAHVALKKPNGDSIASADTTSAGTASVDVGGYTGPIVVEVKGDASGSVSYYDEGSGTSRTFGSSDVLRAIAPAVQSNVGVTTATHAAVEAIKSKNSGAIPGSITTDDISLANNKIATALGIVDVLQAPKLVDKDTSTSLDVAKVEDKYALQLAALAKLATSGKTAFDVANDIASDLSDGKLDGKYTSPTGVVTSNSSTSYDDSNISSKMSTNLVSAAGTLATDDSNNLITSDSSIVGSVTTDVTKITTPSGVSATVVQLAKAMFAELRTTFSSLANTGSTGFLNNQASRVNADVKASVAPAANKVFNRVGVIGTALKVYDAAQAGVAANGVTQGTTTVPGEASGASWFSRDGQPGNAWKGYDSFHYCYTLLPVTATSSVTCYLAGTDSAGPGLASNNGSTITFYESIKLLKIVLTPTATANQFTYVATRENRTIDPGANSITGVAVPVTVAACGNGCGGTVSKTVSNNKVTAYSFAGTMPPSTASTSADKLDLSAAKTLVSGNTYRYALSGSVSTTDSAGLHPTSFALESGSQADVDETNMATTGTTGVALTFIGSTQTSDTKLTGTLSMSGFVKDASGTSTAPSSMVISGSMSDTSTGGAGTFLTGKLESTTTAYGSYDDTKKQSDTNFVQGTVKFTGTIQAPSRPLLKLVVSGTKTGANAGTATLNYSYGSVSITGTGTASASGNTFALTNQDGLQIAVNPSKDSELQVTKAGSLVATIVNSAVTYVDGSGESFK